MQKNRPIFGETLPASFSVVRPPIPTNEEVSFGFVVIRVTNSTIIRTSPEHGSRKLWDAGICDMSTDPGNCGMPGIL
ncbi:unnamed protein product [Prunus brigantina]